MQKKQWNVKILVQNMRLSKIETPAHGMKGDDLSES